MDKEALMVELRAMHERATVCVERSAAAQERIAAALETIAGAAEVVRSEFADEVQP